VSTRLFNLLIACQRNKETSVEKAADTTLCIAPGTLADTPNCLDAVE